MQQKSKDKKIFWFRFNDVCPLKGTSNFQRGSELYKESHVERDH